MELLLNVWSAISLLIAVLNKTCYAGEKFSFRIFVEYNITVCLNFKKKKKETIYGVSHWWKIVFLIGSYGVGSLTVPLLNLS